jgi:hypothetical protein
MMHSLGQTQREVQGAGTGRVDIAGAGVSLESIPSAHHIVPQRLINGARRGAII